MEPNRKYWLNPNCSSSLVLCLVLLSSDVAAEEKNPKAAAAQQVEQEQCLKRQKGRGLPSMLKSLAELSAIRAWTDVVKKKSKEHSAWHNAKGVELNCARPGKSQYYSCQAVAQPCKSEKETPPKT